jgi:hypothetical protein
MGSSLIANLGLNNIKRNYFLKKITLFGIAEKSFISDSNKSISIGEELGRTSETKTGGWKLRRNELSLLGP